MLNIEIMLGEILIEKVRDKLFVLLLFTHLLFCLANEKTYFCPNMCDSPKCKCMYVKVDVRC